MKRLGENKLLLLGIQVFRKVMRVSRYMIGLWLQLFMAVQTKWQFSWSYGVADIVKIAFPDRRLSKVCVLLCNLPHWDFSEERLCPQSQVCLIFIWRGQQCFEGFTHCHSIANKWKQIACFLNFVLVALAITKASFSVVLWPLPSEAKGDNCRKPDLIFSHWVCLLLLLLLLFLFFFLIKH